MDFGEENGAKLAPKTHPTCGFLKIRKMPFGASPLTPNEVRGVQVGRQNRSKIDRNLKSKIERLLAFSKILECLGRQVGRENRAKIDQKSMPKKHRKNDEKTNVKNRILWAPAKDAPWRGTNPGTP